MTEITEEYLKSLSDKTLIIDRKEYIMTGRIAKKTSGGSHTRVKFMLEVYPKDAEATANFLIWVDPKDIFVVDW